MSEKKVDEAKVVELTPERVRQSIKDYFHEWYNTKSVMRIAVFSPRLDVSNIERFRKLLDQLSNNGKYAIFASVDVCPECDKLPTPTLLDSLISETYDRAIFSAHLVVGVNYDTTNTIVPFSLGFAAAKKKPTLLVGEPIDGEMAAILVNGYCKNTSDVQRFIDQLEDRANIVHLEMRIRATLALFRG